jgi:hypothetical protein
MLARTSCLLLAMLATSASASLLPLRPGTYVQAGSACRDPAFAVMFDYDGQHFSYPHATQCTSTITSHAGRTYRLSETCKANGDGSPATADTTHATYTVLSSTRVSISHGPKAASSLYRWCGASPKAPLRAP